MYIHPISQTHILARNVRRGDVVTHVNGAALERPFRVLLERSHAGYHTRMLGHDIPRDPRFTGRQRTTVMPDRTHVVILPRTVVRPLEPDRVAHAAAIRRADLERQDGGR